MSMPKFSAEAALYRTAATYRTRGFAVAEAVRIASQDYTYLREEAPKRCTTIIFNGKVTVCCCDANGDNCECTGIV